MGVTQLENSHKTEQAKQLSRKKKKRRILCHQIDEFKFKIRKKTCEIKRTRNKTTASI